MTFNKKDTILALRMIGFGLATLFAFTCAILAMFLGLMSQFWPGLGLALLAWGLVLVGVRLLKEGPSDR